MHQVVNGLITLAHSLSAQLVHLEGARLLIASGRTDEALDRVERARGLARSGLEETRRVLRVPFLTRVLVVDDQTVVRDGLVRMRRSPASCSSARRRSRRTSTTCSPRPACAIAHRL